MKVKFLRNYKEYKKNSTYTIEELEELDFLIDSKTIIVLEDDFETFEMENNGENTDEDDNKNEENIDIENEEGNTAIRKRRTTKKV